MFVLCSFSLCVVVLLVFKSSAVFLSTPCCCVSIKTSVVLASLYMVLNWLGVMSFYAHFTSALHSVMFSFCPIYKSHVCLLFFSLF